MCIRDRVWGTDGKGQALPFAVSRPLLRLGAGQRAKVEVLYQGQGLPTDRETYLLLSVLDVPHAPSTPEMCIRDRRRPCAVGSQPEATGFAAAVLRPALRAAWSRPAAMVVLPISVSVPVTKNAGICLLYTSRCV